MIDWLTAITDAWSASLLSIPLALHALFLASVWVSVVVTIVRSEFFVHSSKEPGLYGHASTAMAGVLGALSVWAVALILPMAFSAALLIGALSFLVKLIYQFLP